MLKQRLITALVLGLGVLAAIFLLPPMGFALVVMLVVALGAWEWADLAAIAHPLLKAGYAALSVLALAGFYFWADLSVLGMLLIVTALAWAVVVVIIAVGQPPQEEQLLLRRCGLGMAGLIALVPAGLALIVLQAIGPSWLLFLLLLTATADTAAYFTGKRFGRQALAPNISPGKTREGLLGGLAGVTVLALLGASWFGLELSLWFIFVCLCLITALISVVGDLFESLLKRAANAKDSGRLLPGHGGVLDRIDSLTAAAPVFLLGLLWAGIVAR